jgi:pyruvate/2-oxoglutarate dehydrogenase complex dihydrolipoamide dehydrogenase (E3) component
LAIEIITTVFCNDTAALLTPFGLSRIGYQKAGVGSLLATASFLSKGILQVGDTIIKAKNIVVAPGASPRRMCIPGGE